MEISAAQGIINLIFTLGIYAGLLLAVTLLFESKSRLLGLLIILFMASVGSLFSAYLYWVAFETGYESLAALAILPVFLISLSLSLIVRFARQKKLSYAKSIFGKSVINHLPLTIVIFALTTLAVYLIGGLIDLKPNLLVSYLATVTIALLWRRISHIRK